MKFVSLLELHGSFVSIYPDDVHKIGVFHCCIDVLVLVSVGTVIVGHREL